MNVLVDGVVYRFQKFGGINTYFNEIIPRLARYRGTCVEILVPTDCMGVPPGRPAIQLRREPIYPRLSRKDVDPYLHKVSHYFTRASMELRARSRKGCVFHSSYLTYLKSPVAQVATIYDLNHERFPDKYDSSDWGRNIRKVYRQYVQVATRLIAISQQTAADAAHYYGIPGEKIDVVPLAVSPAAFYPDRSMESNHELKRLYGIDRPFLFYVGHRNDVYKNFAIILRALVEPGLARELLLVVAGNDWNQEELTLLRDLGLTDRVKLVKYPSAAVLRNLYSSSLAFVYPSLFEGFGVPLLEAMACQTLVIAADTPVFHEVAGNGALFFPPHDVSALGQAFASALQPAIRDRFVERGTDQVKQFSWDRCAGETHQVYQKALVAAYG